MESKQLLEQYFPQYTQLKASQIRLIVVPLVATLVAVLAIFISRDHKGILFSA